MDLEKLSPRELHELVASAQKLIAGGLKLQIAQVRAKIQDLLREQGLSFEDVYGGKRGAKTAAVKIPAAPKYVNPKDAAQTWSGRGKRPQWFVAALASGKTEQSLLIHKEAVAPGSAGRPRKARLSWPVNQR